MRFVLVIMCIALMSQSIVEGGFWRKAKNFGKRIFKGNIAKIIARPVVTALIGAVLGDDEELMKQLEMMDNEQYEQFMNELDLALQKEDYSLDERTKMLQDLDSLVQRSQNVDDEYQSFDDIPMKE